eukprot:CAMPEP_0197031120 /NCGR_PEP_ID=MMETSP1384-20130603/10213_1 /TAXON_ID=29189 /ORGANISM="Ammonia sp." /LENGTH=582 /DNA_ID=CAMNT_0042460603 /DNA_START=36 /DNA_END=1784 /DNA_ORIENTATION=+
MEMPRIDEGSSLNVTANATNSTASARFTETDVWMLSYGVALIVCCAIFVIQILGVLFNSLRLRAEHRESHTSQHNAAWKILVLSFVTYTLSIAGIACVIHRLHAGTQTLCDYTYSLTFALYASIKIATYFFFLLRAKLAQGISPMFKDYVFDKILPCILVLLWLVYIGAICFYPFPGQYVISKRTGRKLCIPAENTKTIQLVGIMLQTGFDIFFTAFFLYLFGKPMFDLNARSKVHDASYGEKDRKLSRTVTLNFVFSSVACLHTAVIAILFQILPFFSWYSVLDYAVSALCLFLMLASNRRFALHCFCCCRRCKRKAVQRTNSQQTMSKITPNVMAMQASYSSEKSPNMKGMKPVSSLSPPVSPENSPEPPDFSNAAYPAPKHLVLSVSAGCDVPRPSFMAGGDQPDRPISFCKNLCCGVNIERAQEPITTDEWMQYLDDTDSCCYYKSKLLWTWIYFTLCCCHCYTLRLAMPTANKAKRGYMRRTMNGLIEAFEKLFVQKHFAGMDTDLSTANGGSLGKRNSFNPSNVNTNARMDNGQHSQPRATPSVAITPHFDPAAVAPAVTPIPEDLDLGGAFPDTS